MTDPEASAIFREAFYAEAKALEKEALAHPVEVDEERMEALRRRILQSVGAEADDIEALEKEPEDVPERTKATETPMPTDASLVETKQKHRRFPPLVRWAAVLALACVGVLGVSMSSQAKGSGLWSSIQRLIGVETRWDQDDNGEDRNISNPEEYKAIGEIEEKLGITIPKFFYWPNKLSFQDVYIFEESSKFMVTYTSGEMVIYFEGWKGNNDSSENSVWQGEGEIESVEYDGTNYTIAELRNDVYGVCYYAKWSSGENIYAISGITSKEELEKILKNIKN